MPIFTASSGCDLFYRDECFADAWETPETVLLLHGNAESSAAWNVKSGDGVIQRIVFERCVVGENAFCNAPEGIIFEGSIIIDRIPLAIRHNDLVGRFSDDVP